jgi:hypothetical protein
LESRSPDRKEIKKKIAPLVSSNDLGEDPNNKDAKKAKRGWSMKPNRTKKKGIQVPLESIEEKQTPWDFPTKVIPKSIGNTPKRNASPKIGKAPSGRKKAPPLIEQINRVDDSDSDRPNDRTGSTRPNV